MASSGVNVIRYSALLLGVAYGVYHQSALSASAKINEINRSYQQKENLIQKAKAEWTKKTMPAESKTEGGGVISDPNDSRFDLEAYLTMKMADEAK
ncbi:MAG: ATP synthase subunit mitochondrial [Lasallia pustulata]|uniref:ATP synthase F(0) complex subunit e, mitochondrial n=1 Tax=Lasallia pustulata TaxID=136370 RepID=A0A5M8PJU8_9LECA|nr:MAG: ATP synthase subunit mitochondrial [Lasallia pustulata]